MLNSYNELLIHIYRSFLVSLHWKFACIPPASVTRLRHQQLNGCSFCRLGRPLGLLIWSSCFNILPQVQTREKTDFGLEHKKPLFGKGLG